jgi:uncharacterized membrane protein
MLVCIGVVNSSRAVVLLLGHYPDISLDLLGVLVISRVINLEVPNIGYKLSLNDTNYYLALVSNIEPRDARLGIRLLYIPC